MISKFTSSGAEFFILTVSGHMPPLYSEKDYKTTIKEAEEAYKVLGVTNYEFLNIPATMGSNEPVHELNGKISSIISDFLPEIVLIPFPDRHIDHRVIFESSMVATRPVGDGKKIEIVASYETLSETEWGLVGFHPNYYEILTNEDLKNKISAFKEYKSQIKNNFHPRSEKGIKNLAKIYLPLGSDTRVGTPNPRGI